jgi:hypothetical protein
MSDENTEQTTETTESTDNASREELIAAVREAGGTESVDVGAEAQAAAERTGVAATTETKPAEEEEPRIAALLKAREKATAEREAARDHARELLDDAKKRADQMLEDARTKATQAWEDELARRRKAFEASPLEQARQLAGGDTQRLVDEVMRDGTPEARAQRELRQQIDETRKLAGSGEEAKKEVEELRAQIARQNQDRMIAEVRQTFLGQHATTDKAPYAHAEYGGPDGVFHQADLKAAEWQKQGLVLHRDFDFADVAQYIEREAKQAFGRKLETLGLTPAQQVSAGAPAKEPGIAPKVPANGPRTLSAATSSERRTSPKPLTEMSPAEQRRLSSQRSPPQGGRIPTRTCSRPSLMLNGESAPGLTPTRKRSP